MATTTSNAPARHQLNGDSLRVLIIDDNRSYAESMAEALRRVDYDCTVATSGEEGASLIESDDWDVILTDLKMADVDGLAILKKARELTPDAEVVMITGYGDVKTAVEAIKQGAANYLTKPVDLDELRAIVQKASERRRLADANRQLKRQLDERFGFEGLIGNSPAMQDLIKRLRAVSGNDVTVLLLGETGTGKDLAAKAIHNNSSRKNKPFAPLNCVAPNESLIEDELFGHDPGAFTGGERMRKGIFEYANGGTVFLDEIGDMPYKLQAKLLRVLENREVKRIGGNDTHKINVRLISATHRNLKAATEANEFREDLYQRLNVATIRLPALRERREDIPLLVAHFIKEFNSAYNKQVSDVAAPIRKAMQTYHWPGNVRELRNFIESMMAFDSDGVLGLDDVPEGSEVIQGRGTPSTPTVGGPASLIGRPIDEVERYYGEEALKLTGGNREEAAKMLGMGERTLYRKIQDWKFSDRVKELMEENNGDLAKVAAGLEMSEADLLKEMKRLRLTE